MRLANRWKFKASTGDVLLVPYAFQDSQLFVKTVLGLMPAPSDTYTPSLLPELSPSLTTRISTCSYGSELRFESLADES